MHWASLWTSSPLKRFKSGAFHTLCHRQSARHWLSLRANQRLPNLRAGGTNPLTCTYPANRRACLPCPRDAEVRSCIGRETAARRSEPQSTQAGSPSPTGLCFHRLKQKTTAQPQMEIFHSSHTDLRFWFLNGRRTCTFCPRVLWF